MGGVMEYQKLYALQDEVLKIVFETEQIFYLTGGTCLSRFYHPKRYSDDLDFFTHDNFGFSRALRAIKEKVKKHFHLEEEVTSRDFVRWRIEGLLQVDFVYDSVKRYKEPVRREDGYVLDTPENILSNKITAVIGRDNPKDIFDIYLIDKYCTIDWNEIMQAAHEKATFNNDDLIVRLKTFPRALLKHIFLIDPDFLENFSEEFEKVIAKIEAC